MRHGLASQCCNSTVVKQLFPYQTQSGPSEDPRVSSSAPSRADTRQQQQESPTETTSSSTDGSSLSNDVDMPEGYDERGASPIQPDQPVFPIDESSSSTDTFNFPDKNVASSDEEVLKLQLHIVKGRVSLQPHISTSQRGTVVLTDSFVSDDWRMSVTHILRNVRQYCCVVA